MAREIVRVVDYALSKEEQNECNAIAREGREMAEKWRQIAPNDDRGMFVFMAALDCIHRAYPGCFNTVAGDEFAGALVEWIAAGKPDKMADIPMRLKQRYGVQH
jgi:hypothetical protein